MNTHTQPTLYTMKFLFGQTVKTAYSFHEHDAHALDWARQSMAMRHALGVVVFKADDDDARALTCVGEVLPL